MFYEPRWDNEPRYIEKNIGSNNYVPNEGELFIKVGTAVSNVFLFS